MSCEVNKVGCNILNVQFNKSEIVESHSVHDVTRRITWLLQQQRLLVNESFLKMFNDVSCVCKNVSSVSFYICGLVKKFEKQLLL